MRKGEHSFYVFTILQTTHNTKTQLVHSFSPRKENDLETKTNCAAVKIVKRRSQIYITIASRTVRWWHINKLLFGIERLCVFEIGESADQFLQWKLSVDLVVTCANIDSVRFHLLHSAHYKHRELLNLSRDNFYKLTS